ncbi:MAG: M3 family oligoendopeptidase [Ignavibacteria bacterium]
MKYSEMKYERPDINNLEENFSGLIKSFKEAKSFEESEAIMDQINLLRNDFESLKIIAFINYSIDTNDARATEEQDYFDNIIPVFSGYTNKFYEALLCSSFKDQFVKKYGDQLFKIAELAMKSFSPEIIEDLQKENHLSSEYTKLKASAKIEFDGKERNLQELEPFMESTDAITRKKAFDAYWKFFSDNKERFNGLFDELVRLRNGMAIKLGYENFIELGYAKMKRVDYDYNMVKHFRENVKKYVVPLAVKLREKQRKRIGVDKLMVYDAFLQFKSGNATPKGDPEWIMNNGQTMYDELSNETAEFYDFMMKNELMDVYSRKGKADMGYCEYIAAYKSPYIFANMNGTEDDITVLTHEAGHAFQAYASRNFQFKEYTEPTMETAEIHSMSMEFLTYPWMKLFFEEDTDKFKFAHLNSTVNFLPYGVLVDEFQHWVYENPSADPKERKSKWREMEKIYMPHINYGDNEFLESGGRWQKQSHIYEMPFYYIDYCLAQVCAFQFWSKAIQKSNGEYKNALKDYIKLCEAGGSKPFLELVKYANLESPFEEGVIEKLVKEIEAYIDSVDDGKF